jgi:hypothetical protein
MKPQGCIRCGRWAPAQDSDAFIEWGVAGVEVICPGCRTVGERTAMMQHAMLMEYEAQFAALDAQDET